MLLTALVTKIGKAAEKSTIKPRFLSVETQGLFVRRGVIARRDVACYV